MAVLQWQGWVVGEGQGGPLTDANRRTVVMPVGQVVSLRSDSRDGREGYLLRDTLGQAHFIEMTPDALDAAMRAAGGEVVVLGEG